VGAFLEDSPFRSRNQPKTNEVPTAKFFWHFLESLIHCNYSLNILENGRLVQRRAT